MLIFVFSFDDGRVVQKRDLLSLHQTDDTVYVFPFEMPSINSADFMDGNIFFLLSSTISAVFMDEKNQITAMHNPKRRKDKKNWEYYIVILSLSSKNLAGLI